MESQQNDSELTATSTRLRGSDGTCYAWEGLTVDPSISTPGAIVFFTDMSSINIRTGRVKVLSNDATITVYKPGEEPEVVTRSSPQPRTTPAANKLTGAVITGSNGVQIGDGHNQTNYFKY